MHNGKVFNSVKDEIIGIGKRGSWTTWTEVHTYELQKKCDHSRKE